jgi:hypothetical protein
MLERRRHRCDIVGMNLARIRERLSNGFRPFAIELTNGRRFEVPHPEFLIVGRNVIGVLGRNDVITTIDALHIVSVNDLPRKRSK